MNPLRPLAIPAYRFLFAAMVLAIFAQGAWALYLAMQTLDLGATPATLASVVAWSGIGLLAGSLPAGVVADRVGRPPRHGGCLSECPLRRRLLVAWSRRCSCFRLWC